MHIFRLVNVSHFEDIFYSCHPYPIYEQPNTKIRRIAQIRTRKHLHIQRKKRKVNLRISITFLQHNKNEKKRETCFCCNGSIHSGEPETRLETNNSARSTVRQFRLRYRIWPLFSIISMFVLQQLNVKRFQFPFDRLMHTKYSKRRMFTYWTLNAKLLQFQHIVNKLELVLFHWYALGILENEFFWITNLAFQAKYQPFWRNHTFFLFKTHPIANQFDSFHETG